MKAFRLNISRYFVKIDGATGGFNALFVYYAVKSVIFRNLAELNKKISKITSITSL